MNILETVVVASRGIAGNLTRSILTVLMVVIGVGSVITLVAVGNGTTKQVNDQIASLGASAVDAYPGFDPQGFMPAPLTQEDADAVAKSPLGPDITLVAPISAATAKVVAGDKSSSAYATGTTPDYFTIKNSRVVEGRVFSPSDVFGGEAVAVIDGTLAKILFPDQPSVVGKTILVAGSPMKVIGVLAPTAVDKKFGTGGSEGNLFAPIDRVRATISGFGPLAGVVFSAKSPETVDAAKQQATAILTARGSTEPSFYSSDELRETLGGAQESLNGMLASVAGISLLVGGIGVTNVMLLTVRERTREIGIRKALGAQPGSIAGQFVLEATVLSVVGGGLGVLLALVVALFPINGVQPLIDGPTVLLAAGLSVVIGVFFGTYPAVRAARMNPVEALRVGT
ncbi:ABC transporter permease [Microbacterium sp. A8/3-1]|uniref:ABC transporter permease n=1 Tax=Microbacterium sp. A8/3-1 TaxID=3160749 RepID=A0AAU7VRY8_9MICO